MARIANFSDPIYRYMLDLVDYEENVLQASLTKRTGRRFHLSRQAIFGRIAILKGKNYFKKAPITKNLSLTPKGKRLCEKLRSDTYNLDIMPYLSLHKHQNKYIQITPISKGDLQILSDDVFREAHYDGLKNNEGFNFKVNGIKNARLSTSSLILTANEVRGELWENLIGLQRQVFETLNDKALEIQHRANKCVYIRFAKKNADTLICEVLDTHIALRQHPFAKLVLDKDMDLVIKDKKTGNKVEIDNSDGYADLETDKIALAARLAKASLLLATGKVDLEDINIIKAKLDADESYKPPTVFVSQVSLLQPIRIATTSGDWLSNDNGNVEFVK